MPKRNVMKLIVSVCLVLVLLSNTCFLTLADEETTYTENVCEENTEQNQGSGDTELQDVNEERPDEEIQNSETDGTEEPEENVQTLEPEENTEEIILDEPEENGSEDIGDGRNEDEFSDGEIAAYAQWPYTSITGTLPDQLTSLNQLYYGSVANDPTAPFHNADELKVILEGPDVNYAKSVWKKYRYDLYDPNYQERGGCGALVTPSGAKFDSKKTDENNRPDYADELLESTHHEYPKDGNTPFHEKLSAKINPVESGTLVNGGLVENDENIFENLQKSASPDAGDSNQNREYTVDLKATPSLKQLKPVVFLFQIQTSWQMFDKMHANDRASLVDGQAVTADLLSLYEMKQGFRDFMDWMQQNTDGSLMLGITNFQHGGTNSMIGSPYFTNDTGSIMEGLNGWDSFGDCEHIHYSNQELMNAIKSLNNARNFSNWVDAEGNAIYDSAEIVSIIVGGACETNDLKSGSVQLPSVPDKKYSSLKHQYGIRTNSGTGAVASDMISWMDYCAQGNQKSAGAFDTGKYYKNVVTREQFFNTLKEIYEDAQEKLPNDQNVTDVTLEDTVTAEFDVKASSIKAFVDGEDVTDQAQIQVTKQNDGTTKVSCNFGTVGHKKEVHLQIPVQAKTDFIGSNNVYTNQGTPTVSYTGRLDDTVYTQEFTDTPAVNVPVQFEVSDGQKVEVKPGDSTDLAELAKKPDTAEKITQPVEDLLNKYEQTEGTLTYQWVDAEGNPVGNPTSATVNDSNRTPPEIPSCVVNTTEEDAGKDISYRLRVTFTPADVREETTSKVPVGAGTETGTVGITVSDKKEGRVYIKKVIDNYQPELSEDAFIINVSSAENTVNAQVVLKHGETSSAIVISEKTTLNITEILPKEYEISQITISGGGQLNGNQVIADPGEEITVTVHNRYSGKAFFQSSDAVKNIFHGN